MKVTVQKSFEKDVLGIRDRKLATQLNSIIIELESCEKLSGIKHLKKMSGGGNYYRIRVGNYRVGLKLDGDKIILLRAMPRKDIYKYFP